MTLKDLLRESSEVDNEGVWDNERTADTRALFRGSTSFDGAVSA